MSETAVNGVEPIIFLDDVHVTFRTRTGSILHPNLVHAVQGVTIKLMPGQTIGIVGESGCGKSTTGRTITEADILNFAGISGEWAPIHMDLEYCKAHGYETTLAQHMLVYTFTPSINPSDPMMAKMNNSILATKGTKNWKFLKMPAVGDTVYTTSEIVAKDDNKPERGVIIIQMSMIDQNGDVLQTGEYHLVLAEKIFFEKQFEAAAAKAQQ